MNLSLEGGADGTGTHEAGVWQVDTGPVAVPDLSKRYEPAVACVSLGYIATNNRQSVRTLPRLVSDAVGPLTTLLLFAPAWQEAADFVLEQPTAGPGGEQVLHFSTPYSAKATNRLFAVPLPEP